VSLTLRGLCEEIINETLFAAKLREDLLSVLTAPIALQNEHNALT